MILTSEKLKQIFKKKKVILAPMAGITSFSYRSFMSKFGVSLQYSEMISDCGLIYNNKETDNLLYTNNKEKLFGIQIFGGSKESIIKGIKLIESRNLKYDFIDLNLACPVKKVIKNNGGSSWLNDLEILKDMVNEVVKTSKKPVTCKIRIGIDDNHINLYEVCKILQDAGVIFIAIHARTQKQLYYGEPDYKILAKLKDFLKIPYGISGNIFSVEDAKKALDESKADAVLVARGGVGNPLLIKEINYYVKHKKIKHFNRNSNLQSKFLLNFAKRLIKEKGERKAISLLRGIAPKFYSNFKNVKEIRFKLSTITSYKELIDIVNNVKMMEK